MSLVLYRKYRPQKFSEIIGQEHVVQTIKNAVSSGVISHAYIFSGPRGSGKTTIARLLAKSLNCRNRKEGDSEPCNKCQSCLEIMEGRSLDLIEIDAASHRGIDEIRELRDGIRFSPVKEKYKVFILDEAHQLTKEAVNALLKTLEEPPSHAIFIMATTEIHKMLPTVISRCQRHDFKKLTLAEIVKRLLYISKQEKAKIEMPALELIALNSYGAARDAESLLGQVLAFSGSAKEIKAEDIKSLLGIVDSKAVFEFVDFLAEKKAYGAVLYLNNLLENGFDPQEFAKSVVSYLRRLMVLKMNPEGISVLTGFSKEEAINLKAQTAKFNSEEIKKMLRSFLEAESRIKYSSIPQLPLELAIVDSIIKEA